MEAVHCFSLATSSGEISCARSASCSRAKEPLFVGVSSSDSPIGLANGRHDAADVWSKSRTSLDDVTPPLLAELDAPSIRIEGRREHLSMLVRASGRRNWPKGSGEGRLCY